MSGSSQVENGASIAEEPVATRPPVVVKKYANRRLYNTESSSYITLDTLADMVRVGRDFVVYDARSGDDITRGVLTQIIVEEEGKGRAMLPTGFLRQLISFYGDSMQTVVPRYLEQAMTSFARQQEQVRTAMQQTLGPFLPFGIEEVGRQNMAMMERAMSLFTPGRREPGAAEAPAAAHDAAPNHPSPSHEGGAAAGELAQLRAEVEALRLQLAATKAAPPEPETSGTAAPSPATAVVTAMPPRLKSKSGTG